MHQKSPLRYTTSKSQSWIPWCRRLPLPRPAVREKEITNEWPFRQGLQSWSWWLSDWVARGKTWHVMESYPTSDEFFFCKQRNTLDELLGCFSINNWLDELFYWFCFQCFREANISKHPEIRQKQMSTIEWWRFCLSKHCGCVLASHTLAWIFPLCYLLKMTSTLVCVRACKSYAKLWVLWRCVCYSVHLLIIVDFVYWNISSPSKSLSIMSVVIIYMLTPPKLTWTAPKVEVWRMSFLFKLVTFRFQPFVFGAVMILVEKK